MHDLGVQILIGAICVGFLIVWFCSRYLPIEHRNDSEEP